MEQRFQCQSQPLLSLEGDGLVAERQFTGTGFAVGDGDALVTNRHVALPWENDANVAALADQGLEPVMIKFIVYVPGKEAAGTVELVRVLLSSLHSICPIGADDAHAADLDTIAHFAAATPTLLFGSGATGLG